MTSAFITGAAGQDGVLLAELLVGKGYDVWGYVRKDSLRLPALLERVPQVNVLAGDIRDRPRLGEALRLAAPDEVYNLAALSSVSRSWDRVRDVMDVNTLAVVDMLEELREIREETGREVRYYQASSSEMFGATPESPQREETACHPRSPYGVSKAAAHSLTVNYRESYGMYACSGILYNHESPLRDAHFVTRKITMGVAAIGEGRARELTLGTLDVARDWGYAPDYVRAMWLMLQQGEPADYIVATGHSRTLAHFLSEAFACIGVQNWSSYVTVDQGLVRPLEAVGLVGNADKARSRLGWAPSVTFPEVVARMVHHDVALLQP